jgi:hypothetical protein
MTAEENFAKLNLELPPAPMPMVAIPMFFVTLAAIPLGIHSSTKLNAPQASNFCASIKSLSCSLLVLF